MAFARDVYTATTAQTDFTITYSYQEQEDVKVYVNGTLKTITTDYTFPNATTIRLVVASTEDDVVVIQRSTSQAARDVDFVAGTLTETDLDDSAIQAFYMAQEAMDIAGLGLLKASDEIWDATSVRIKNVDTPTESADAVTKSYVDTLAISGTAGTPVAVADGGTGSATASAARTALGLAIDTDVPSQASFDALNVMTTRGDIIKEGATVQERLGIGTAAQYLTTDGTDPSWAALTAASDTVAGVIEIATAAEQETGTSAVLAVTPGRQQSHVSAAKAWIAGEYSGGTPTALVSYNIASMDDDGTGLIGMHFSTAFSGVNFPCLVTAEGGAGVNEDSGINTGGARAAGTIDIQVRVGAAANDAPFNMLCLGDQ